MGSRGHRQNCNMSCQKSAKATLTDRYKDYGSSTISMLTMRWPSHTILRLGNAKVSIEESWFSYQNISKQPALTTNLKLSSDKIHLLTSCDIIHNLKRGHSSKHLVQIQSWVDLWAIRWSGTSDFCIFQVSTKPTLETRFSSNHFLRFDQYWIIVL